MHEISFDFKNASFDFLPTYCFLQKCPKLDKFLLATNDFTSPIIRSSVLIAEDIETFIQGDVMKLDSVTQIDSTITNLTHLNQNLVSCSHIKFCNEI